MSMLGPSGGARASGADCGAALAGDVGAAAAALGLRHRRPMRVGGRLGLIRAGGP
jgi:hypothetical protein